MNADQVVAEGAAIQAAILTGVDKKVFQVYLYVEKTNYVCLSVNAFSCCKSRTSNSPPSEATVENYTHSAPTTIVLTIDAYTNMIKIAR